MQKFIVKCMSVVAISSLSATVALAAGHHTKITMDCPDISMKTKDKLTNYGTYIAGLGTERVNSDTATYPLFQGPIVPGANIPVDLKEAGYDGSGVSYNPANGAVTCYFKSSKGFDPFSVSYLMMNALDGVTIGSGDEQIHIKLPVGLK
jgi:hypothetical protein